MQLLSDIAEVLIAIGATFAFGVVVVIVVLSPLLLWVYFKGKRDKEGKFLVDRFSVRAFLLVLILVAAALYYAALYEFGYQYSGLMFVGLPALISILVLFSRQFNRPYRAVFVGLTAMLILSGVVLQEGLVCIVVAIPVFYFTGFWVVFASRWAYKHGRRVSSSVMVGLFIALMSIEGTSAMFTADRETSVLRSNIINLPLAQVKANLAHNPDFSTLPVELLSTMGFPVPISASGSGLEVGDVRHFVFQRFDGVEERVSFTIDSAGSDYVELVPVFDNTLISQWLKWEKTRFSWKVINDATTELSVTMHYQRKLDPAWYFGMIQKLVVGQAAQVLIAQAAQTQ